MEESVVKVVSSLFWEWYKKRRGYLSQFLEEILIGMG